ncbi:Rz1-like lysis system protein LysC [Humitalea sp. 24SJ18S-53]|uniref:Rz1-like lysis system protein LysC n=1 Tax=Humitalea sp. 24SJ18S-53 TaxID=3422307 RepID=UPI003D67BB2E
MSALLISCASVAPVPEVRLVRTPPPAPLLVPPAAPALPPPGAPLTQGRVGELLLAYDAALATAAAQLRAIACLYPDTSGAACGTPP